MTWNFKWDLIFFIQCPSVLPHYCKVKGYRQHPKAVWMSKMKYKNLLWFVLPFSFSVLSPFTLLKFFFFLSRIMVFNGSRRTSDLISLRYYSSVMIPYSVSLYYCSTFMVHIWWFYLILLKKALYSSCLCSIIEVLLIDKASSISNLGRVDLSCFPRY